MSTRSLHTILGWALLFAATLTAAGCDQSEEQLPRFVRQIPWVGNGVWLKIDTHTHTKFSDGQHTVDEVVAQAELFGCDCLAITDHGDMNLQAATKDYMQAIKAARRSHPNMIIIAGLEWNIPPWDGREHATVLIAPCSSEGELLAQFKKRFDGLDQWENDAGRSTRALKWLAANTTSRDVAAVVIYNHPSRKQLSGQIEQPIRSWRKTNGLVVGFSGAPGHQASHPIGSYRYDEKTIDRWDPAAARIGDAWDRLLQKEIDVWAARAPSDFHVPQPKFGDYWPGQFSETWVYAPDRSAEGVLRALRAGTFFAAHGHIARQVVLSVQAPGLERAVWTGEAIKVQAGTSVTAQIDMIVPQQDWTDEPNRIDTLELIAVTPTDARIIASRPPQSEKPALTETISVPPGGMVLRARGRRIVEDGPDLMFYTNPVRVLATDSP